MKLFKFLCALSFISIISSINAEASQLTNFKEGEVDSSPLFGHAVPSLMGEQEIKLAAPLASYSNPTVYDVEEPKGKEEDSVYDKEQLEYIADTINRMVELFSREDLFICPGRSCVHFSDPLKALGYHIVNPAFSKGHIVLNIVRLSEHQDKEKNDLKRKELQEKLKQLPEGYLKDKINLQGFLKEFEDLPFYIDFNIQEVRPSDEFLLSKEHTEGYREYLKEKCDLSPSLLKEVKGNIILFDSVCSGGGMGGFIKVFLDWCEEEKVDVSHKIKVLNFNSRVREKPQFESNNPLEAYWDSMVNLIAPYPIWKKFSYNHILTQSEHYFFFPPWTWDKPQLWESLSSQRYS